MMASLMGVPRKPPLPVTLSTAPILIGSAAFKEFPPVNKKSEKTKLTKRIDLIKIVNLGFIINPSSVLGLLKL
jgi:hypothetical protein